MEWNVFVYEFLIGSTIYFCFLLSRRIIGLFVRMKRPEKKIVEEKSRFVDYYFSDKTDHEK